MALLTGKNPPTWWPDGVRTRLEVAEYGARSAVAGELLVEVADDARVKRFREELRYGPVDVGVDPVAIVGIRILEVVRDARDRREFVTRPRIEVCVASARVDRPVVGADVGESAARASIVISESALPHPNASQAVNGLCMVAVPRLTLLLAARVIRCPRITRRFRWSGAGVAGPRSTAG